MEPYQPSQPSDTSGGLLGTGVLEGSSSTNPNTTGSNQPSSGILGSGILGGSSSEGSGLLNGKSVLQGVSNIKSSYVFEDYNVEHIVVDHINKDAKTENFSLWLDRTDITSKASEYHLSFNKKTGQLKTLAGAEINKLENLVIKYFVAPSNYQNTSSQPFSVSVVGSSTNNTDDTNKKDSSVPSNSNSSSWVVPLSSSLGGVAVGAAVASVVAYAKGKKVSKKSRKNR